MSAKQFYTIGECAAAFHITRQAVHYLIGMGRIRAERTAGGKQLLIPAAEFERVSRERAERCQEVGHAA